MHIIHIYVSIFYVKIIQVKLIIFRLMCIKSKSIIFGGAHSSTLAWKIHGWRSLVGCSPWSLKESDTTERLHFHFSLSCIGEGNGNPLQCSCLENSRDGRAWWAAVFGVTQSQTWLKQLSSSSSSLLRIRHDWSDLAAAAWIYLFVSGLLKWKCKTRVNLKQQCTLSLWSLNMG